MFINPHRTRQVCLRVCVQLQQWQMQSLGTEYIIIIDRFDLIYWQASRVFCEFHPVHQEVEVRR